MTQAGGTGDNGQIGAPYTVRFAKGQFAGVRIKGNRNIVAGRGGVRNFAAGIVIEGGSANTVTRVTVEENFGPPGSDDLGDGIVVLDSTGNQITTNTVRTTGPSRDRPARGRRAERHPGQPDRRQPAAGDLPIASQCPHAMSGLSAPPSDSDAEVLRPVVDVDEGELVPMRPRAVGSDAALTTSTPILGRAPQRPPSPGRFTEPPLRDNDSSDARLPRRRQRVAVAGWSFGLHWVTPTDHAARLASRWMPATRGKVIVLVKAAPVLTSNLDETMSRLPQLMVGGRHGKVG